VKARREIGVDARVLAHQYDRLLQCAVGALSLVPTMNSLGTLNDGS
jgi:hypothetical protein